jgi:site-specific DNA recombinase
MRIRIDRIDIELVALSEATKSIDSILKKALGNLANLSELFKNGDNVQKRKIIGSIFPEKIVFDGENCRTKNINTLISLKLNLDKAFEQKKIGKKDPKINFSSFVARSGSFSTNFLSDLTRLAQICI